MPSTNIAVTIPAGESLSNSAAVGDAVGLFLTHPPGWSGGNLTFEFSMDGSNFSDLFGTDGHEITMPCIVSGIVPVDVSLIPKGGYIKVRAGSRFYPRIQAADRAFILTVVT